MCHIVIKHDFGGQMVAQRLARDLFDIIRIDRTVKLSEQFLDLVIHNLDLLFRLGYLVLKFADLNPQFDRGYDTEHKKHDDGQFDKKNSNSSFDYHPLFESFSPEGAQTKR